MKVKLLTPTDFIKNMEHNAAYAMLTCHANTKKLQNNAPEIFIEKAIKDEHESILEHITLTYEVNDLSRACLQELARHRHISLSVESTRHTLKTKLKSNFRIDNDYVQNIELSSKEKALSNTKISLGCFLCQTLGGFMKYYPDISNDELKYYIPEFWPTNLVMTANIRELRHIVKLRTNPAALKEFQDLAHKFVEVLPDEFKYLLEDCIYKNEE